ncbi:MAG TPA: hypothetical protein VKE70_14325 [Candidatus Solibacter sp.]|nr:hypothetical protein [Candidatus Solibacter sp.]
MKHWIAWNIFFRAQEWVKGHSTFKFLAEMEAVDLLSASELEAYRVDKLRELLAYCYAHVPYVRARMEEAGVVPEGIRRLEDLRRLPLMTKTDIRRHRKSLRSEIARDLTPFTTGGSTGEPLIFDLAKRRIAARVASRQRVARWWGVTIGDREFALWGSPIELNNQQWIRDFRDRLLATTLFSAFEMNEATMSRYLDILESGAFRQLFAYPSAIYLLCLQARKQGRNLRRAGIKVVFVTGEVLFPYQRKVISETLNCPVADGYGGRDSGCIAHECPQGGLHELADGIILELLDPQGRPVAPGEPGEVVATDLFSHEAPFLRYATGDVAIASARQCPCGRALPLLERVEGRSNDSVVAPDGRIINSLALIYPVREVEGIEQFRIRQQKPDRFHVQLVRNERYPREGEERIRRGWTQLLRTPVEVAFEYMSALPAERSGKFRHFISELPDAQAVSCNTQESSKG